MAPSGSLRSIDLNLAKELQDKEFCDVFFEEISRYETAEQIRELRLLRGKTQTELADDCDMLQPAVSRLEKPDYGKWNFHTLVRLAVALDARIKIQLIPREIAVKEFDGSTEEASPSLATARTKALESAQLTQIESRLDALTRSATPQKNRQPPASGSMLSQDAHNIQMI